MKPINVEITMGHDIGISQSYYKPTERDVLEDYLKAVHLLTISGDQVLQKQIEELQDKSNEENYVIKGKLVEREKEIQTLKQNANIRDDTIAIMQKQLAESMKEINWIKRVVSAGKMNVEEATKVVEMSRQVEFMKEDEVEAGFIEVVPKRLSRKTS